MRVGGKTYEEDNGRRRRARFAEQLAHRTLALPNILVQQLRPLDRYKVYTTLCRQCAREYRLTTTRRTSEQHSTRRGSAQARESCSMYQWPFDTLAQRSDYTRLTANIGEAWWGLSS